MSQTQSDEVVEQPDRPLVVVGVSQTSHSPVALRWAADYAGVIGANLLAVRAWRPSHPPSAASGRPAAVSRDVAGEREYAASALYDDVQQAIGPEHAAHSEIREGTPLSVLTALSRIAALLVIDAPRRTDLSTTPMLAHRLVYNAACPVVVMPPRISQQPDSPLVTAGKWLARGFVESAGTSGRPGIRPPSRSTGGGSAPE
ncbi:universal stress protein [Microlunatus soli]|uniref:Universal stress protein family protein n=1 Tax=Microlunatus soli TaxID=630515 RepID=A0A1H1X651_9ACTN|nr:universal stress protein [Microlunatus soli]SDT04788.1 Universal stress protein family protein [Microlunatus soli]